MSGGGGWATSSLYYTVRGDDDAERPHPRRAAAASLVRPRETRLAVASGSDSLQDVGLRVHAAADGGGDRRALFQALCRAIPHPAGARIGDRRSGHGALVRARVLRARPQPATGRGRRGRGAWRGAAADRGSVAHAAGCRPVYGGGGGRDRIRVTNAGAGW